MLTNELKETIRKLALDDFDNNRYDLPEGISFFGLYEVQKEYFHVWQWAKDRKDYLNVTTPNLSNSK